MRNETNVKNRGFARYLPYPADPRRKEKNFFTTDVTTAVAVPVSSAATISIARPLSPDTLYRLPHRVAVSVVMKKVIMPT
jgi:hypothetical protein